MQLLHLFMSRILSPLRRWPDRLFCGRVVQMASRLAHREVCVANILLERISSLAPVLTTPNTEFQPARGPRAAVGVAAVIQRRKHSSYGVLHVHIVIYRWIGCDLV